MISFESFTLDNGLKVIIHKDNTTPIVAVNILYNVGAKDEDSELTGFAHLFEHLMFGGSVNIPDYDSPLQNAGGENNAFTTNDFTNYYLTIPKINMETAFWLESDRMLSLAFNDKTLEVQRKVVIEEFKQRYINQPYGDVNHLLRKLAYNVHPYQWPTIGKDIKHIEQATQERVKDFFFKHYAPNNAILSVAGNVTVKEIKPLAEKWFGNIPQRLHKKRKLPVENEQTKRRFLKVTRKVPATAIFKAYHMSDRNHQDYYATDLISDLLSNGKSSRLYQRLVKEQHLFTKINAFISGSIEPGLFQFEGILNTGVKLENAEAAIDREVQAIAMSDFSDHELNKVKNKFEANYTLTNYNIDERALNLAYFELLGDANRINLEIEQYNHVNRKQIVDTANKIFCPEKASVLYYVAQNDKVNY